MDLSKLAPSDGIVALKSLERRYRNLFAEVEDASESLDEIASRTAGNGWTALEHTVAAARDITAAARVMEAVLTQDAPLLDPTDVDPAARSKPQSPTGTVHERLAELGFEANALAEQAERVPSSAWDREGAVADSSARRVTALDVLRTAVDSGVTHLKAAGHCLEEARRQT